MKKGDLVQLKSGGPALTVVFANPNAVTVRWFEGSKLRKDVFEYEVIKKFEAGGAGDEKAAGN